VVGRPDADGHEVVLVTIAQSVPRAERPLDERARLRTELRGGAELGAQNGRIIGVDRVPVARVGMALVEIEPREIVAERRVVDATLLEQIASDLVNGDVRLALENVMALEERARLGTCSETNASGSSKSVSSSATRPLEKGFIVNAGTIPFRQ